LRMSRGGNVCFGAGMGSLEEARLLPENQG
jgi:hypothetical protein